MPCRPIAFSMPAGVSTMRGGACPSRSARNRPLTATPPSVDEIDDVAVFDAVAETSARGDQRIRAASARRWQRTGPCQCASAFQTMREASNTGPSMHDRTKCGVRRARRGRARRSCSSRRGRSPSPVRATRRTARPCAAASSRDGAHHRRRAADVQPDVALRRLPRSAASSGAVTYPLSPRLPSSVARTTSTPKPFEQLDVVAARDARRAP